MNLILVIGSGKTLVAILRIQHELEQTTTPKVSTLGSQ